MGSRWLLLTLAAAVSACSFDSSGSASLSDAGLVSPGDAALPDAPSTGDPPDASPPPGDARPPAPLGAACGTNTDCGLAGVCLDDTVESGLFPADGYCSRVCANNGDCGSDGFCAPSLGDGPRLCFARCPGGESCRRAGQVCTEVLAGAFDLGTDACLPANTAAVDGDPCDSFGDCAPHQFCANNPFETPGGMCLTLGCTVGDDSTCAPGGDGVCIAGETNTFCLDACSVSTNCRVGEGYQCVVNPSGPNVCLMIHADPGAPCDDADDCASGGPWVCLTGSDFPGGYCSGTSCDPDDARTCPDDSHCYDPTPPALDGDEFCVADCTTGSQCRPGYACVRDDPSDARSPRGCR